MRFPAISKSVFSLLVALLSLNISAPAQKLVYAVSSTLTASGFHARYPTGVFGASDHDKLAMLRQIAKTEIYSVSMVDGARSLLFSDDGMDLEISPAGGVTGANKVYVNGVERQWRKTPTPGAYADPTALYELSLDGSRAFRRLLEKRDNQSSIVLDTQETKAAVQAFVDGKYVISVYDFPGWNLLHRWELGKITAAHCPDCLPLSFGWLAGGDRLFLNLVVGDEDTEDHAEQDKEGIYLTSTEGADLGILPADIGLFQLPGYRTPQALGQYLLGQLPNGSYVFQAFAVETGGLASAAEPLLLISNPETKSQRHFPLKTRAVSLSLSPSGEYLAFIEERQLANYKTERHLWIKDLNSGVDKDLLVTPPPHPPTSPEPNLSVTILGWLP